MNKLMSILSRISNLFSRTSLDREIESELQSHIEMRTEDNLAQGMSPEHARRDALARFGNPTVTKEDVVFADAAVIGSAIVGLIEKSAPKDAPAAVTQFIEGLRPAAPVPR